jgi:hypothetical protein
MPIVHFKGKVLPFPSPIQVMVKDLPSVDWFDSTNAQTMRITTRIDASIIDMEFDINAYDEADLSPLLIRAWDLARAAVDLYCYQVGWGLSVVIDTFVNEAGVESTLLPKMESLAAHSSAVQADPNNPGVNNFDVCYRLIVSEPPLFMALNDLIVSITLPHHASVNCARAIEGLRVLMVPAGTDRKQAWPIFQGNLNVDRDYREYVTGVSTGPRHGDRTWIPGTTVIEVTRRSWIIMNRFLEYRKRGNQPLPLAEFPLLSN